MPVCVRQGPALELVAEGGRLTGGGGAGEGGRGSSGLWQKLDGEEDLPDGCGDRCAAAAAAAAAAGVAKKRYRPRSRVGRGPEGLAVGSVQSPLAFVDAAA